MKRFVLTSSLLSVLFCGSVLAQEPGKKDFLPPPPLAAAPSLAAGQPVVEREEPSPSDLPQVSVPPEMWLYMHEQRRYDDPKQAVRRKAEQRAADRQARLAALRWYGYSNSRPMVSASPWMSTYSPFWAGNSWDPYRFNAVGGQGMAVRVDQYETRR